MNIKLIKSLLIVFSIVTLPTVADDRSTEIDKFIQEFHDIKQFNGTVLVSKDGHVLFEKAYGYANFEWDIKNTPNTKYRIASITKQFAAMLVLQLVQEGKIALDAPITQYLPNYRRDTGDKVTIHQLLNHTSGIPDFLSLRRFRDIKTQNPYSVNEFVTRYCSEDLAFEPGSKWRYSNAGYTILGNIIEKVSGKSFWDMLDEKILIPLQMTSTGYDATSPLLKNRASGYEKNFRGFVNAPYYDMKNPYASGSMYSTARDLMRWDAALYSNKLLNKKLTQKMYEVSSVKNYSYGWFVDNIPKNKLGKELTQISHAGSISGFHSYITRLIEDKYLIVILNNTGPAPIRSINNGITKILYNQPHGAAKPRVYTELFNEIDQFGLKAGIKKYHALNTAGIKLGERGLNYFGYELLKVEMIEEAIAFFTLAVELAPNSSNAHDSLAEAYMVNKNNKLALVHYQQSLKFDKTNSNAQKAIARINAQ